MDLFMDVFAKRSIFINEKSRFSPLLSNYGNWFISHNNPCCLIAAYFGEIINLDDTINDIVQSC